MSIEDDPFGSHEDCLASIPREADREQLERIMVQLTEQLDCFVLCGYDTAGGRYVYSCNPKDKDTDSLQQLMEDTLALHLSLVPQVVIKDGF